MDTIAQGLFFMAESNLQILARRLALKSSAVSEISRQRKIVEIALDACRRHTKAEDVPTMGFPNTVECLKQERTHVTGPFQPEYHSAEACFVYVLECTLATREHPGGRALKDVLFLKEATEAGLRLAVRLSLDEEAKKNKCGRVSQELEKYRF